MNLKQLLKIAINASIEGGQEIIKVYETEFEVEQKSDHTPLTLADKNCNNIIEDFLVKTNIPILSEEGNKVSYLERKKWEYFWLVDPLDGTKEFVKRNGEFTVNIALIHNSSPIMGVIFVPVDNVLYYAMEGLGSFKINRSKIINNLDSLILDSKKLPLDDKRAAFVVVGSRSHMSSETEVFFENKKKEYGDIEVMAIGSSLKICMVAEGKADAYPRYAPTMEWDTGAGHAIAKMAGFSVLQYNTDKEIVYNKKDLLNPWFLVK